MSDGMKGPIIRINPKEIHISDPDFHDAAYSPSLHVDKLWELEQRFGLPLGVHATVKHSLHKLRRVQLNSHFSKQKIKAFAPYIQECTDRLCDRLRREYKGTGKVLNISDAWATLTTDLVFYHTFAWTYNLLDYPDFVSPFTTSMNELCRTAHVGSHFPWLTSTLQSIPDSILGVIYPAMRPIIQSQNVRYMKSCKLIAF